MCSPMHGMNGGEIRHEISEDEVTEKTVRLTKLNVLRSVSSCSNISIPRDT